MKAFNTCFRFDSGISSLQNDSRTEHIEEEYLSVAMRKYPLVAN